MNFGSDGRAVDVSDSRFDIAHGTEGSAHVLCINRARKPIRGVVQYIDRCCKILHLDDRQYRPENLLSGDAHVRRHIVENRRLKEIAVGAFSFGVARSADNQPGPFLFTYLDVALNLLARRMVDEWSHLDALV